MIWIVIVIGLMMGIAGVAIYCMLSLTDIADELDYDPRCPCQYCEGKRNGSA